MLRINRTDALIGIETIPARLSIKQPKVDFELKQKQSKVEIQSEQIQVRIDQRECFNESGLKDNTTFSREAAELGKQAAMQAIDRITQEGNLLADISGGSEAIADAALQNTSTQAVYEAAIMPASRPKLDFVGGNVDIRVEEGLVEVLSKPNKPVIEAEPGEVKISLRQRPQLDIEYIGNSVDKKV